MQKRIGNWTKSVSRSKPIYGSHYLEISDEWIDAGDWEMSRTEKAITLTRTRKPEGYLPGAIEALERIRVQPHNWDSGMRHFYPHSAGIPIGFFEKYKKENE